MVFIRCAINIFPLGIRDISGNMIHCTGGILISLCLHLLPDSTFRWLMGSLVPLWLRILCLLIR